MTELRVSNAVVTDMTGQVTNFSVDSVNQDTPGNNYTCDWDTWYGYYSTIPELQAVIDAKARWTTGKGFKCDDKTRKTMDRINGNGKDTADDIFYNAVRVYTTGGDFFAEIIATKRGDLRNLKPLNSGTMTTHSNVSGRITGYTQNVKGKLVHFKPEEIFHLQWNRLGDECHGHSTVEKLIKIIESRNEAMDDMRIVFHRYVKPLLITEANTEDPTELAALKTKQDSMVKLGENMIIPMGSMKMSMVAIPQYSTLDPLPWIAKLNEYFLMAEAIPGVILGTGELDTESSSKIKYVSFQQMIEHNQNFLERQFKAQLGLDIEFEFPADLMDNLQEDQAKDGTNSFSKSDVKP